MNDKELYTCPVCAKVRKTATKTFQKSPIRSNREYANYKISLTITSFTKRKYKCMGVQPSGTPYMITQPGSSFYIVNPSNQFWVAMDSKLH